MHEESLQPNLDIIYKMPSGARETFTEELDTDDFPSPLLSAYKSFDSNSVLKTWHIPIENKDEFRSIILELGGLYSGFKKEFFKYNHIYPYLFNDEKFDFDSFDRSSPYYDQYLPSLIFKEGWGKKSIYALGVATFAIGMPEKYKYEYLTVAAGTMLIFNTLDSFDRESKLTNSFSFILKLYKDLFIPLLSEDKPQNPFEEGTEEFNGFGKTLLEIAMSTRLALNNLYLGGVMNKENKNELLNFLIKISENLAVSHAFKGHHSSLPYIDYFLAKHNADLPSWITDYFYYYCLDKDGSLIGFYALLSELINSNGDLTSEEVQEIKLIYGDAHSFFHILLNDSVGIIEDYHEKNLIYRLLELEREGQNVELILSQIYQDIIFSTEFLENLDLPNIDKQMPGTINHRLLTLYNQKFAILIKNIAPYLDKPDLPEAFEMASRVIRFFNQKFTQFKNYH